ncbi:MAG: hypothetical protein AAFZ52_15925, partial [Bacteroidota bacterium]
ALSAQTTERERQAEDDLDYYSTTNQRDQRGNDFRSNLWYGTGAQLGFSSNQFESFFQLGLSPIVGYHINNFLSVGPRGSFAYNRYRADRGAGNPEFVDNYFTWSIGPFARAKIINPIFLHIEYSLVNEREVNFQTGELQSVTRAIPFLGGGLNQGGGPGQVGFELLVLFRLNGAERINDSPFEFRTGLNVNF